MACQWNVNSPGLLWSLYLGKEPAWCPSPVFKAHTHACVHQGWAPITQTYMVVIIKHSQSLHQVQLCLKLPRHSPCPRSKRQSQLSFFTPILTATSTARTIICLHLLSHCYSFHISFPMQKERHALDFCEVCYRGESCVCVEFYDSVQCTLAVTYLQFRCSSDLRRVWCAKVCKFPPVHTSFIMSDLGTS